MHIQVPADAPLLVKVGAAALLATHIGGAAVGLISGTTAMLSRKGGRLHRQAGDVFVAAMVVMGGAGAVTGPFLPQFASAMMGVFVCYLAVTAWQTVRQPAGGIGRLDRAAFVGALAISAGFISLGVFGATRPGGLPGGEPYQIAFFAGAIAALAAAMDWRMLNQGGVTGRERLRRHIWRISLALFITWGSFAGQPKAQPEAIRGAPWLFLPALGCLALMAYWMVRNRDLKRRAKPLPAAA